MTVRDVTADKPNNKNINTQVYVIESSSTGFKYKVHRHILFPGTWFLTVREYGIEGQDLKTNNVDAALSIAREIVFEKTHELMARYALLDEELRDDFKS